MLFCSRGFSRFRSAPSMVAFLVPVLQRGLRISQRDASLGMHHSMVSQAVMSIFRFLKSQSVEFLEGVLSTIFVVIR